MIKLKQHKSHHNVTMAGLLLGLLVIACSSALPVSPTRVPQPVGSIIYSSDESGNFEIYHMNILTHATTRLTDNTASDSSPFYLPPAQFGFVSDRSGKYQIYTMKMDGSDQAAWKKGDKRMLLAPSVSPDGKKMAFIVQMNNENSSLYLSQTDGSAEKQITDIKGLDWEPNWSPDGKKIAFYSDNDGDFEINLFNIADEKITQLTDNNAFDGRPRWSPDGKQIAFESDRDGDWEIYVMGTDGKNLRQVTENSTNDWGPCWSPDGNWLVYVSSNDGDDELYLVDLDGKGQRKLTNNGAQDQFPFWIP